MDTIQERANKNSAILSIKYGVCQKMVEALYVAVATEQEAIDEANPSDAVIMRILNAIGYEEESWIPIVKKNLETREE
ncbi:MAG: hypothetical protein MJZ81_06380 [Bacteroidales bacterium]|nr:hypothetical protein [Bacteroidales bacterium]